MPKLTLPFAARGGFSLVRLVVVLALTLVACRRPSAHFDPKNQTYAELRLVRRGVTITPPGEHARAPYPRERLADGAEVALDAQGLAWLRRDGGATMLIAGPAKVTLRTGELIVDQGKLFVDTLAGGSAEVVTPKGPLHLSGVRASLTVGAAGEPRGSVEAYVLAGEVKTESGLAARAGEELVLGDGAESKHAVLAWDDWTGGLATTDESMEPAPFGVGTVAARRPGARGHARFPLAIQKLEVRVTIDHDLAITEVDELFFNPSADVVEGIYQFRTPTGATLHRFGVDRDEQLVWGRVKEKAAAAAQYQSNVYAGSTEDPALLEWDAPGVYQARLYPIAPGGTRRVVTRYAEWLARQGEKGERRLYVYPMAAEGAEASLPRIEELRVAIDLTASGATDVRTGMRGVTEGKKLIVHAYDVTPRADLAVELFDGGEPATTATAYRAKHTVQPELLAAEDRAAAEKQAKSEADYLLLPVRPTSVPQAPGGLDVAVVVDTSAATDPASLAIARTATSALLAHLDANDRVAVWASDATLRPVAEGSGRLAPLDDARRSAIDAGLARVERGGATDLGAVLADAASKLDPTRRGFVVYIGDGRPSVGELAVKDLRDRLAEQPHPCRLFALGIGAGADMGVLGGIARGGFAERVVDGHGAALSALHLLEEAERPVWLGVKVDFGLGVDRVYPREMTSLYADQTALVVGRVTRTEPTRVVVSGPGGTDSRLLTTVWVADDGDLRRRWAEGRLVQLLDEGAGRAAVVEVGAGYGVVTPFTSYYVPTTRELAAERERANPEEQAEIDKLSNEPGGSATRAKGEEGSMGNPSATRYGVSGPTGRVQPGAREVAPAASATAAPERDEKLASATTFGMIGLLDNAGSGGLGLSGVGEGGGGAAEMWGRDIAVGSIGTIGHGTADGVVGSGNAIGFGNGHGRLGGGHLAHRPSVRAGAMQILDSTTANAKALSTMECVRAPIASVRVEGSIGFQANLCNASAAQPLDARVLLWRERLLDVWGNAAAAADVYRDALAGCEAPTWAERSRLLHLMLDALPSVTTRVRLWRSMFEKTTAADILYRGILARVHTTAEMRELHDALGLKRIDPELLRLTLAKEKTPHEKVTALTQLVRAWPDDLELALRLLDAYEDAGDVAGERAFARKLRRRDDVNAKVRTAVGEAYLRLAKLPGGSPADEGEARRAFGEIVEFAVDDPVARRRLGDLLRSHGWYDEAFRQYETLAKLTPDDGSVALLLASAAAGMGKIEEAVGWTEKAAASGAPDGAAEGTLARDLASVYLAWAEDDAVRGGRKDEAKALRERAARLSSQDHLAGPTARVFLTWSHPEVHATLWGGARGSLQPASEGDPLLGLAAVTFPASRHDVLVEVRMEPDDADAAARLDAEAQLTLIYGEGTPAERVLRVPIHLRPARATRRFRIGSEAMDEEVAK